MQQKMELQKEPNRAKELDLKILYTTHPEKCDEITDKITNLTTDIRQQSGGTSAKNNIKYDPFLKEYENYMNWNYRINQERISETILCKP